MSDLPNIQKLPEHVINRIAAGEVIVRPSNAVKELIENSLDAKSTKIGIQLADGGLKQLQISDNGHGIRVDDYDILCERFTTSKLSTAEDLRSINTFGFRGEALASISHISLLNVTSRTDKSPCAFTASYVDGKMQSEKPKPSAGQIGTIFTFSDLFYNMPTRRQVLGSASEELNRIIDVIQRYSLRYPTVAFSVRKTGKSTTDLRSSGGSTTTTLDVAKLFFGSEVSNELKSFSLSSSVFPSESNWIAPVDKIFLLHDNKNLIQDAARLEIRINGLVSGPSFPTKRGFFTLFINNRLVENSNIKRAVDYLYSDLLPKGTKPWVFLSLDLPAENLDVNVHPTKREVLMLHETLIIDLIVSAIRATLEGHMGSRIFRIGSADEGDSHNLLGNVTGNASLPPNTPLSELSNDGIIDSNHEINNTDFDERIDADGRINVDRTSSHRISTISPSKLSGQSRSRLEVLADSGLATSNVGSTTINVPANQPTQLTFQTDRNGAVHLSSSSLLCPTALQSGLPPQKQALKAVRVRGIDAAQRSILEFSSSSANQKKDNLGAIKTPDADHIDATANCALPSRTLRMRSLPPDCDAENLASVSSLLADCERKCEPQLLNLLRTSTFVGAVSAEFALIQNGPRLLLADLEVLAAESVYQSILKRIGRLPEIELKPAIPLRELVRTGFLLSCADAGEDDEENILANISAALTTLENVQVLLWEYFSILFETNLENGGDIFVSVIPEVIEGSPLNLDLLCPLFYRLAAQIDWNNEQSALDGVAKLLADFSVRGVDATEEREETHVKGGDSSVMQLTEASGTIEDVAANDGIVRMAVESKSVRRFIHDVLFNVVRSFGMDWFVPAVYSKKQTGVLKVVTSLDKLYKIFERC